MMYAKCVVYDLGIQQMKFSEVLYKTSYPHSGSNLKMYSLKAR